MLDFLAQVAELLKRGDVDIAVAHCHSLLRTHPGNGDVLHLLGLGYVRQNKLADADRYFVQALQAAPRSPSLLNDIGILRMKQEAYDDAIRCFSRALELDPRHSDALNNIATAFNLIQQPASAKSYLERLVSVLPLSAHAHTIAGENSLLLSDTGQAIRYGRNGVSLAPDSSRARLSLADTLETVGRFKQAKFQYLSVLSREPSNVAALSKLLSLDGTHIAEKYAQHARRLIEGSALKDSDRVPLHLALAHYYDQRGQFEAAFAHLKAGNDIRFRNNVFDSAAFRRAVDRLIQVFSGPFISAGPSHDVRSTRPIFIVGMPRSGTTLVEQILASHSQIAAGGELPTIINLAAQINGAHARYPEQMRDLDRDALQSMATLYLEKINAVSNDAARVTDKMPFNFMHLGLIVTLFPGAKIIHCQRDALDTCLSCYFTSFTESLQFASDLDTLGRYYLEYRRLMEHWHAVLPARPLEVEYEYLVTHTEDAVRQLLGFCGVEWEAKCIEFYNTVRGVRTPSRWQVRQPIYRNSLGRWRRYEQQLQPLLRGDHSGDRT